MWHRKTILFLCILLFFSPFSETLSQSGQVVPIKAFLSADSAGVKAGQTPRPISPGRNGVPIIRLEKSTSGRDILRGPALSPTSESQWVRLRLSGTELEWLMRKPGTYAGKVLVGSIESNGEVSVRFQLFGELLLADGSKKRLKTYYAISAPTSGIGQVTWINPDELNNYNLHFDEHPIVPATWALWQKIEVGDSAPSAEYEDQGIISIELLNNDTWIEPTERRIK